MEKTLYNDILFGFFNRPKTGTHAQSQFTFRNFDDFTVGFALDMKFKILEQRRYFLFNLFKY